jgi:cytochrome c6
MKKNTKLLVTAIVAFLGGTLPLQGKTAKTEQKNEGKKLFAENCVVCHGPDGAGTDLGKSLQVADLRSSQVQKQSDAELTRVISEGKGNMPAFKSQLTQPQIAAVLAYVRSLGKSQSNAR